MEKNWISKIDVQSHWIHKKGRISWMELKIHVIQRSKHCAQSDSVGRVIISMTEHYLFKSSYKMWNVVWNHVWCPLNFKSMWLGSPHLLALQLLIGSWCSDYVLVCFVLFSFLRACSILYFDMELMAILQFSRETSTSYIHFICMFD